MQQQKGKLITLEGCEGVGKTTQIALLKSYFEQNKIDAIFLREPGGTAVSEQIRQIILNPQNQVDATTELLLYASARAQLNSQIIRPALNQNKIVVCDRYIDSTTAYQGFGRGIDLKTIAQINDICCHDIFIDLTVFFDLNPAEGFKRKGGADKSDRMDSETMDFHQRVYCGYKHVAQNNARVECIDATQSKDEIFEQLIKTLHKRGIIN